MKTCKVLFESESGHRYGDRTFLGSLAFVVYVFGIPLLLLNSDAVGQWADKVLLGVQGNQTGVISKYYKIIVTVMAVAGWLLAFKVWGGIGYRALAYSWIHPWQRLSGGPYFRSKIREDFKRSQLGTQEAVEAEIGNAIEDSKRLAEIASDSSRWLDNRRIWELRAADFRGPISREILSHIHAADHVSNSEYQAAIQRVRNAARGLPEGAGVDFYVASVQPAFYLAMQVVLREAGLDKGELAVISNSETGPGTVRNCLNARKLDVNPNRLTLFVAPLSAFLTTEVLRDGASEPVEPPGAVVRPAPVETVEAKMTIQGGEEAVATFEFPASHVASGPDLVDPRDLFSPVVVVTTESQTVFFVEGRSSAPQRPRRLFYLNNSTAEECVACKEGTLAERFQPEPVRDFEDYKKLLRGKRCSDNRKLEPGDGIVLWSPLSQYFEAFGLGSAHLAGSEDLIGFANQSDSRILLFSDKRGDGDHVAADFMKALSLAFVLRVSMRSRMLRDRRLVRLARYVQEWWTSSRLYREGFQSQFAKLFS